ncbi:MAG: ABC transporter permease subunit [Candidatus Cloacimonetes bacterium]|nr:ABC transporter permease subunit [Candidatus Cloacimonadota bacterium]
MIMQAFIKHEILNLLKSKRVYWTIILFMLLFASVFTVRTIDFKKQLNQYIQDVEQTEESLRKAANYSYLNPRAIKQPLIFSIYNNGYTYPRVINIQYIQYILNTSSLNQEKNNIYTENNMLDISFLVSFFLSLFILLIAYDSVNGEKEIGTLRILMTWPIKRQSFILKKILGIFFFVFIAFSLPYLLSLFVIIVLFGNLLTSTFFLSFFFYWFVIALFIFFFSLLGIYLSVLSAKPSRSLVYSLLVWIFLSIICPVTWEYIISPKLFNNTFTNLKNTAAVKLDDAKKVYYQKLPDEANINKVSHFLWNNYDLNVFVWGEQSTYDTHYRFHHYLYDKYYPAVREAEQARDNYIRKHIYIENVKSLYQFFNPLVVLDNISMKIAGNSRADYLLFLQDGRKVRDDFVNLGVIEGWYFAYDYFAKYKKEYTPMNFEDYQNENPDHTWFEYWMEYAQPLQNSAELYEMKLPNIQKYQQRELTFTEIFNRIYLFLFLMVILIVAIWLLTWKQFLKYDIR